eukprot:CAMPEP_0168315142 /NCGR_PEP_ID=MMETSP0210-20121227/10275_1 /TAXON_ID=40633 /ORGANISM="Condylostoma magnum, Strain COL2" /LENGTH=53 /DNA_ID=CAMNT_0008286663 /DNA_START=375 /DNA_END=536 /DNA_ORIENTATION=+
MNARNTLFELRKKVVGFWLNTLFKTPSDWYKIFVPGLDTKFALDFADAKKIPV